MVVAASCFGAVLLEKLGALVKVETFQKCFIEHLWADLKWAVRRRHPRNLTYFYFI